MITTPEIICDLFSFLDKDQIERVQLVNQFWNNVIIRHKHILPLRQFEYLEFFYNYLEFNYEQILCGTKDLSENGIRYKIKFDGTNLSKGNLNKGNASRYSQLTVDKVLKNLNDVVFNRINIYGDSGDHLDNLLNMMRLVTKKTGGRFRAKNGIFFKGRFGSKLCEIFDNYTIVDELTLGFGSDSYIREVCASPEIVQLPSTPKEIRLIRLKFKENEEVLHFTCNGKLNGANRLTILFDTPKTNYGNFIRQWFELYRTHENPISLVGKFELFTPYFLVDSVLDAVKTLLNNTQLRVKYSLETKKMHSYSYGFLNQYVKRSCVLHETDSYALVIEMGYGGVTDISSINASDLDQPTYNKMFWISFCVKPL